MHGRVLRCETREAMAVELFEPYPVTGGEIRAAANDTRSRIESIRDLRDQLEGAGRDTLAAVEGDLEGSVANAPTEAVTAGDMTIRDAEYAAGCLEYFAQAVDDFNTGRTSDPRSVQALNQAYAEAYDSGFGVSYSMVDDTSPQTFERTHQRYSQLLGHARQAVMGALIREHSRSQDLLEQAAEDVSKIAMARALRLRVVAEGVETQAQLDYLRAAGCEQVQGYLISRPLPVVEVRALLAGRAECTDGLQAASTLIHRP